MDERGVNTLTKLGLQAALCGHHKKRLAVGLAGRYGGKKAFAITRRRFLGGRAGRNPLSKTPGPPERGRETSKHTERISGLLGA